VSESLPGAATPLTWSVIRDYARKGFEAAFSGLGLTFPKEYEFVGAVRGRVYLNLTEFLSVAGQVPFLSPETLLHLGGVTSPEGNGVNGLSGGRGYSSRHLRIVKESEDHVESDSVEIRRLSPTRFLLRLPLTALRALISNLATPRKAVATTRTYRQRRDALLSENLASLQKGPLLERLDEISRLLDERGGLLLEISSNFLASYALSREALRLLGATEHDIGAVFSGVGEMASAEPGLRLLEIARTASEHPELRQAVLEAATLDELRLRLAETPLGRAFLREIDLFLKRHGQRAAREAELSTPRWAEDPSFVIEMLKTHLAAPSIPEPGLILADRRRLREEATERLIASLPLPLREGMRGLLRHALATARLREELRTQVVEVLGLYRRVFLAIGSRLVEDQVLASAEDIFYLTLPEIRKYLANGLDPSLGLRAAIRKAQTRAFEEAPPPPDSFIVREGDTPPQSPEREVATGPLLVGTAASPGARTGRVRIVTDPMHASLQRGEVLVARQADAGWTPLFLVAGAVVLETGGPLSHACVIAREYGVPVVTTLPQATKRLKDGDLVVVDGDRGVVRVVERASSHAVAATDRHRTA